MWPSILQIFALILFVLAALPRLVSSSWVNLGWAGMACLALYWLVT